MKKGMVFAALSEPGDVRAKNQDNLYCCDGFYLPVMNEGMREVHEGTLEKSGGALFSVFDGMGGESAGETAAYLAASAMAEAYERRRRWTFRSCTDTWLKNYCYMAGATINRFRARERYHAVGTTMAAVAVKNAKVIFCNVGDSRIYRISAGTLQQLSEDHVEKNSLFRNAPLTQYLGLPEEEAIIEPYIGSCKYIRGDRYLICTDGVWSSLVDPLIFELVGREDKSPDQCVKDLMQSVHEYGGRDNASAILLSLT